MNSNVFDPTTVDATVGCCEKYLKKKKMGGDATNPIKTDWIDSVRLFCFVLFCFTTKWVTCCLYINILMFVQIWCIIPMFSQKTFKISIFIQNILNSLGITQWSEPEMDFLAQIFWWSFGMHVYFRFLQRKFEIFGVYSTNQSEEKFFWFGIHWLRIEKCGLWH